MLKIGEFSRLSHLTVKALRLYEKEGILLPASTDEWKGLHHCKTEMTAFGTGKKQWMRSFNYKALSSCSHAACASR